MAGKAGRICAPACRKRPASSQCCANPCQATHGNLRASISARIAALSSSVPMRATLGRNPPATCPRSSESRLWIARLGNRHRSLVAAQRTASAAVKRGTGSKARVCVHQNQRNISFTAAFVNVVPPHGTGEDQTDRFITCFLVLSREAVPECVLKGARHVPP